MANAPPITFGSVCSGIEAASVALGPLGFVPAWLSEIDPFASAVLSHHYPDVPNLGDMTAIARRVLAGEVVAPDVLCGGTPCQAFSVAGLRNSLADARGNLTLKFVELADAIDHVRLARGEPAAGILWENVPGVLSTPDNAFGCFLAGLAGADGALEPPEQRPAEGKSSRYWSWSKKLQKHIASWANAGAVYGPARSVAWRTLDAQYFGVAQRRRRVFVVASARNGFDPAAVLFEWDGMRRDTAPSREAGQNPAGSLTASAGRRGGVNDPERGQLVDTVATIDASFGRLQGASGQDANHGHSHLVPTAYGGNNQSGAIDVATARNATQRASPARMSATQHASTENLSPALGATNPTAIALPGARNACPYEADASSLLRALRKEAGEEAVAEWGSRILDSLQSPEILRSWLHGGSIRCAPGDFRSIVDDCPLPRQEGVPARAVRDVWENGPDGRTPQGRGLAKQLAQQLGKALPELPYTGASQQTVMQVRRLTPTEAERLQGFPDGYTAIPWRGKPADACPDGPRYKALGNSWPVPVVRWIGARLARALRN